MSTDGVAATIIEKSFKKMATKENLQYKVRWSIVYSIENIMKKYILLWKTLFCWCEVVGALGGKHSLMISATMFEELMKGNWKVLFFYDIENEV